MNYLADWLVQCLLVYWLHCLKPYWNAFGTLNPVGSPFFPDPRTFPAKNVLQALPSCPSSHTPTSSLLPALLLRHHHCVADSHSRFRARLKSQSPWETFLPLQDLGGCSRLSSHPVIPSATLWHACTFPSLSVPLMPCSTAPFSQPALPHPSQ